MPSTRSPDRRTRPDPHGGWCRTCCTAHRPSDPCPGPLEATGPEAAGWRVSVRTEQGVDSYAVRLAAVGDRWRARVVTLPTAVWVIPGGGGAMKFVASTPEAAERKAIAYILRHVRLRGYELLSDERRSADPSEPIGRILEDLPERDPRASAIRRPCDLPVTFGGVAIHGEGSVGNVSERGLFVSTPNPPEPGANLSLRVRLRSCDMPLRGVVVWRRVSPENGRPPGMGIRLSRPPALYLGYVRALPNRR